MKKSTVGRSTYVLTALALLVGAGCDGAGGGLSDQAIDASIAEVDGPALDANAADGGAESTAITGVIAFMHVNVNCSDFERSRTFYELLGFSAVMEVEDSVSAEGAAGLNMPPYQIHAAPMALADGSIVDLIEWLEPYDERAPYGAVNHLGIARVALTTTNLAADILTLREAGAVFYADPVAGQGPDGAYQGALFEDPDGTIIELVELESTDDGDDPGADGEATHLTGFHRVHINCSDLERSKDFYQMLGFTLDVDKQVTGTPEQAGALHLASYEVRSAYLSLPEGPTLVLEEWLEPHDLAPPYDAMNHLGMPRIALQTQDLAGDVLALRAAGIDSYAAPITPEGPLGFLRFACFEDPDGTVIELVEFL